MLYYPCRIQYLTRSSISRFRNITSRSHLFSDPRVYAVVPILLISGREDWKLADIRPFRAVRPKSGLEDKIAALPYDVYSREEAAEKVKGDELTFLRIDRPETQFDPDADMYGDAVYEKGRELFEGMLENGQFVEDEEPKYYLYELTMDGRSQTGIVAVSSIDDYLNGIIKKHENTRAEKEQDRIRHVRALSAQTGPIFLAYRHNFVIEDIMEKTKEKTPVFDFVSDDGIRHRGFVIEDKEDAQELREAFSEMDSVYIADGHHRCASAVKAGLIKREENPDYSGDEDFNYFLSVLFPDSELMIMDYNRVIRDLNGKSRDEILSFFEERGTLLPVSAGKPYHPTSKGNVGIYLEGTWYSFYFDNSIKTDDPVGMLDVSRLQEEFLRPLFGIEDPKTDKRIDFVGGIRGLSELEKRCREDAKIAFAMYPTSISELFKVADAGLLMPPKSTWFEPKLRSGLFIHRI